MNLQREFRNAKSLWKITALAMADLRRVERMKRYVVSMSRWHSPLGDSQCGVCFAGAVMASREFVSDEDRACPNDFDRDLEIKFYALNVIRKGGVQSAFWRLGKSGPSPVKDMHVPDYHGDRNGWWAAMKKLLAKLKKARI